MPNDQYDMIANHYRANLHLTPVQQQENPIVAEEAANNADARILYALGRLLRHVELAAGAPNGIHQEMAEALSLCANIRERTGIAMQTRRENLAAEERVPIYSELPANGNNAVLPGIRDYKVETFSGIETDKVNCLSFIRSIFKECSTRGLTHEAAVNMLDKHTTGPAKHTLEIAQQDGVGLEETVRRLEVRYAGLTHPELARINCEKITRKEGEILATVGQRIRMAAKMAARTDRGVIIPQEEEKIARRVFRTILSPDIQQDLDNQEILRRRTGQTDMSFETYVERASELEARLKLYQSRLKSGKLQGSTQGSQPSASVMLMEQQMNSPVAFETHEEAPQQSSNADMNSVMTFYMQQMKRMEKENDGYKRKFDQYQRRGRNSSTSSSHRGDRSRSQSQGRSNSQNRGRGRDRDSYFQGRNPSPHAKKWVTPTDVNCHQGECIKCGKMGHFAKEKDKCYLGHIPLVPMPCPKCTKGGHLPEHCPSPGKSPAKN